MAQRTNEDTNTMKLIFDEIENDWIIVAIVENVPENVLTDLVNTLNEGLKSAGCHGIVRIES